LTATDGTPAVDYVATTGDIVDDSSAHNEVVNGGAVAAADQVPAAILSGTMAANNAYIDVVFSEGVYNTNGGAGALEATDFTLTFNQNTGTASNATISTITQTGGGALTGGETTIRVNLTITGTPSGAETIEVTPVDSSSIYDVLGNATLMAQTTGAVFLKDQLAPTLPASGIIGSTIQGAADTITLTFSEPVQPSDGTWSGNEFTINSPDGTVKTLTGATFTPSTGATTTLTITLAESATDATTFLVNGNAVAVTTSLNSVQDAAGNFVANTKITSEDTITGEDIFAPTMTSVVYSQVGGGIITYVRPYAQVLITATFNEDMTNTPPTITIAAPGTVADVTSQNMSRTSATVWTYTWTVINDATVEGVANITFAGTDLAGNAYVEPGHSIVIDSYAPVVSAFTAGSITAAGATLSVTTNENATCRYANTETAYASMTAMDVTGTTSHSHVLAGLTGATNYNYYVRCVDTSGNTMTTSAHTFFTTLSDSTAPVISDQAPSIGDTGVSINPEDLYVQFDEALDPTTVGSSNVMLCRVTDATCTTPVSVGSPMLMENGTLIRIGGPGVTLSYGTEYWIKVTTGVKNLAGLALAAPYGSTTTSNFTTAAAPIGALAVTGTSMNEAKRFATGATFDTGWEWYIDLTIPTTEPSVRLKFGNLTGTGGTIAAASNVRYYSAHAIAGHTTSGTAIVAVDNDYSVDGLTFDATSDQDATTAGWQVRVKVQAQNPSSLGGSFSTQFSVQSSH